MADFFDKTDDEGNDLPSTFKIGEKEYTQEQVENMVSKAQQVEELEGRYNTKLDRVWPEYGKSQNELKSLKEELEQLRNQSQQQPIREEGDLSEEQVRIAQEQARKIGILTQSDFDKMMNEKFKTYYNQERFAEKLIEDGHRLESEINGSDGRPKFVLEEVLEYMAETGHKDLMKAYKDKYDSQIEDWKAQQLKNARPQPFSTQDSTFSNREPSPIKPTKANIYDLVDEGLDS